MSISFETLALAKKFTKDYVEQHGGDPDALGELAFKDNVTSDPTTASITPMKAVGTLPELRTTVSGKNLTIGFDKGTLPEKDTAVEVLTDVTIEVT